VGERANFSFTEHDESDGSVRVRLVGELDVAGAPEVQGVLRRLEGEGSDVLLDLTGLAFMDSLGLHVIEEAADAARRRGFGFAIARPVPDEVRTVFVAAGAGHHLPGGQAHLAAPVSGAEARRGVGAAAISATDRDHIAAEFDETSADRDQTSSDEDQTGSDRDQAGSDTDQIASERDQMASERDQMTADRDQAASEDQRPADEARYERSREARGRATREREETTDARAHVGRARRDTAARRDATAADRDATAAQRDVARAGGP
jgi:anti-anti-sigma factor